MKIPGIFLSLFFIVGCSNETQVEKDLKNEPTKVQTAETSLTTLKGDISGEYILVLSNDKEFNVTTFDLNSVITITDNSGEFLVTDEEGTLVRNSTKDGVTSSDTYWSKDRVTKYLSNLKSEDYEGYISANIIVNGSESPFHLPTKDLLNSQDKEYCYTYSYDHPFIALGDFNNDGIAPDVAYIEVEFEALYDEYSRKFQVLHAGSIEPITIDFEGIYPICVAENNSTIGFDHNKQDVIHIHNPPSATTYRLSWNGSEYEETVWESY